jgi:hypothetical protein
MAVVVVLLVASGALCAQSRPKVTRIGAHRSFGPGIVAVSGAHVQFELVRAAHVIVVRVDPDGGMEPLVPEETGPPAERAAGPHLVATPTPTPTARAPAARPLDPVLSTGALARAGRRSRPTDPVDGAAGAPPSWWVVAVSDVPTDLAELRTTLESIGAQGFTSVEALVRALPKGLMAGRTEAWAGYYASVEP